MAEINSIGKYEIRREIGRGAMGVVYEGYDPSIKRVVALKTIRADQLTGGDPAAVIARFRREAQAAGRLNHPNIVSIYDFGEDRSEEHTSELQSLTNLVCRLLLEKKKKKKKK